MITLLHVTTTAAASQILKDGFVDGKGSYLTDQEFSGVWLSDRPLDANEGACGDTVLKVRFGEPSAPRIYLSMTQEAGPSIVPGN